MSVELIADEQAVGTAAATAEQPPLQRAVVRCVSRAEAEAAIQIFAHRFLTQAATTLIAGY